MDSCDTCGKNLSFVESPISEGDHAFCSDYFVRSSSGEVKMVQSRDRDFDHLKILLVYGFVLLLGFAMAVVPWLPLITGWEGEMRMTFLTRFLFVSALGIFLMGFSVRKIFRILNH